jgi:hypothetical protein
MAASYAVYLSALLALWSIARLYDRPAPLPVAPGAESPERGGWDLVSELR